MAGSQWKQFCRALQRKKVFESDQLEGGNLKRCLSVWDLTSLGVGSTLGVGVYVLVGYVALRLAGPSIIISFLIAAIASLFAGLCYAEFGARVPRAGSAYIYTYVTVGEFVAFIIGWNMILEAVFGTASVAKGLSVYVDAMLDKRMSSAFISVAPLSISPWSEYFDFFALAVVLVLGVLLAVGVRESCLVNNVLSLINVVVILFVVCAGAIKANPTNWDIPASQVPENYGSGGFFPYGVWGTLKGAAVCFYGFVGFDTISSTGEEVRDPRRAIPISILAVLAIAFLSYASVSTVITMMVPYYLQDVSATVASAFVHVGWEWARWLVFTGAVCGMSASLFGGLLPMPRLLYAMASDGLLVRWLGRVSTGNKSPTIATILSTIVIAVLSAVVELNELVRMMCVGTLVCYTIVASCIILLRYRSDHLLSDDGNILKQIFDVSRKSPTKTSLTFIRIALILFILTCLCLALVVNHVQRWLVPTALLHAAAVLLMLLMALQPQNHEELSFKTPLVPLIPCLSIYVNINLMILINIQTWIRVLIWIAIGLPVYFISLCCYKRLGDDNSTHANKNGKPPVQIFVEQPTPPNTIKVGNKGGTKIRDGVEQINMTAMVSNGKGNVMRNHTLITEDIIVQQAYVEDNEEKEAKIIDLLDQVIQAEEDSYGEIISLKDMKQDDEIERATIEGRKSLSELSDAGSDASVGNQVLSKYDVIAQVHREDLPKLDEEEEKCDLENEDNISNLSDDININEDNNSRTDESGYSDTLDKTPIYEPEEEPNQEIINIPVPPPLDENFFASPTFIKSHTISVRPPKPRNKEPEEELKPRESIKSNGSNDDGHMIFGSDKQVNFMSKLNNIFQNKMLTPNKEDIDEKKARSLSTGNVIDTSQLAMDRERSQLFLELKKVITSPRNTQNLRPIIAVDNSNSDGEDEISMSREDLKSKLENIFSIGGPQLLKTRLMKSNPPTPEEAYQTDSSSTDSIPKLPKMEKNDTLKRQKDKFGEVLNSFRLTLKDDQV
ncbi:cationic amino acid transporter 3-like [Leptidea sinapis]|uniref:cationic amino acid transporter 3-like n=1 Tax=Leptidea sinapis TaxID=189913 RepID=UPI002121C882|nr:cationic amino acid transporter 3-like [Leptidea sinapis]XP_050675732.1 cationic amino acid transporter 3-like [Leptidea sinapis]